MKRLNNRGITTIEILVCFVLLAVISTSLYNTVSVYRNRQILEMEKEKIYTYKNLLTKEIQDDIIKKNLKSVEGVPDTDTCTDTNLILEFSDGSTAELTVDKTGNKISYAGIDYPLPNFGKNGSESVLKIKECPFEVSDYYLKVDIRFEHPDFGDKYGIYIVAPINYTS